MGAADSVLVFSDFKVCAQSTSRVHSNELSSRRSIVILRCVRGKGLITVDVAAAGLHPADDSKLVSSMGLAHWSLL